MSALFRALLFLAALLLLASAAAIAQTAPALQGTHSVTSAYAFDALATRLEKAIEANKMGLVAQASASRGAASRGVKIRGNLVLMVFRNDYAVRMLSASVPAGIEAPLRIYLTEDADGGTRVTWRAPSAVFAPYASTELSAMALELDPIVEKIVRDATTR